MFENMTEQQAKEQLLNMVDDYCKKYHNRQKPFWRETGFPMHPVCMTHRK